jgi:hypothetical protein
MESALEIESPLLSLQAVAKQMKLSSRTLLYYEPELCRQIVARGAVHREQINERIRSTLEQALEQDHLPALKELAKQNGFSASLARKRHPDLWAEIAARRKRQKKQAWESVRQELKRIRSRQSGRLQPDSDVTSKHCTVIFLTSIMKSSLAAPSSSKFVS